MGCENVPTFVTVTKGENISNDNENVDNERPHLESLVLCSTIGYSR